jgi:Uma2 family endonuclease
MLQKPTSRAPRSLADWLAEPAERRLELVAGEFLEKASPTGEHGHLQARMIRSVGLRFDRRPGGRFPGGWWIMSEVDVQLGLDVFRPDLVGWRRDRMTDVPRIRPVTLRPDWIGEVISESNASHDRVVKLRAYHQAGVPHYWLIDPRDRTLTVHRHAEGGYLTVLVAAEEEIVRPEPFEATEFDLRTIFGDADDEG